MVHPEIRVCVLGEGPPVRCSRPPGMGSREGRGSGVEGGIQARRQRQKSPIRFGDVRRILDLTEMADPGLA